MRDQTSEQPAKKDKFSRKKTMKLKLLSLLQREDIAEEKEKTKEDEEKVSSLLLVKPENLDDGDKDASQYDNVSILFSPADSNATLNGLLRDETTTSEEGPPPSSSPSNDCDDGRERLLRMAMRGRERREVEKWVSYQEVSSRYGGGEAEDDGGGGWYRRKGLDLKLDHGEILKAWSDKGSLYVGDGGSSQCVPDLFSLLHVPVDGNGNMWWMVGETAKCEELKEEDAKGQREASVMRYKAKRQSRLFSKRIRYEVRKLNADKRPRLKGRFVKRV